MEYNMNMLRGGGGEEKGREGIYESKHTVRFCLPRNLLAYFLKIATNSSDRAVQH